MKKMIFLLILIFTSGIYAEDTAENKTSETKSKETVQKEITPVRIGIVDIDRVTFESKSLRNLVKEMENTVKSKQDEMDTKINAYQDLKKKIEQQKEVLSEEELNKKKKELSLLNESIADLKYEINKMLKRSEKESIEPALDRILEAVKIIAEEKKLDAVFRSDLLLYINKNCDITDIVIKKLDELTEKNPIPMPKN